VQRDFALNGDSGIVEQICERLDRLPLAIELAAARIRLLAPAELLSRLERRLPLLKGGAADLPERQRTLKATIEWSYDLLAPEEQMLLRHLAIFAGSFELDAAEEVCAADLVELESLLAKSLLRRWGSGRLGMLETIGEFAREQLEEAGEAEGIMDRHASYFLKLAEELEPQLRGGERRLQAIDRLSDEIDNLRAALNRFEAQGSDEELVRLATALWRFWMARGQFGAGRRWIEHGLEKLDDPPRRLLARALEGCAPLVALQGDLDAARLLAERALDLYRGLDDVRGVAESLNNLAFMALVAGDQIRAEQLFEESARLARESGDEHLIALTTINVAALALEQGLFDRAAALATEAAALFSDPGFEGDAFRQLGAARYEQGRYADAGAALARCLAVAESLPQREMAIYAVATVAALVVEGDSCERAARLLGAADAALESIEGDWEPHDRRMRQRTLTTLQERLGEAAFTVEYDIGRSMSFDDAVEYALASVHTPSSPPLDREADQILRARPRSD
jgi:tetratricopeptide (TPR) repeat protein